MRVGWIGLGQMGLETAGRIAAAGHDVHAYDIVAPVPEKAAGLTLATTPREAAAECDLLCIAVFSDDQVQDVLTGNGGVLATLAPDTTVAIFTTGTVEFTQQLAEAVPAGITVLDTCFSRRAVGNRPGMMTLLIGGDGAAIERMRPVFESFADAIVHVGPSGAGRALKLANNILFATNFQAARDALRLAGSLGLDRARAAEALSLSSGGSDVMARFVTEDPEQLFGIVRRYMAKDVSAAVDAANRSGATIDVLAAATAGFLN